MSKKESLIWVLADDRPGNYSQAIGLATFLKRPYEIKNISYNCFAKLPNFIRGKSLIGISSDTKSQILSKKNKPKIIISAGRRTASVALFLKQYYKDVFLIHIMNPSFSFSQFDLVILPEHDNFSVSSNIITSIGSLSRVEIGLLECEYKKFSTQLNKIKSPKIALLVGGSSKKGRFDVKIAKNLATIISDIVNNMSANLLITTSRRTGEDVVLELKNNLKCNNFFFEWQEKKPNPYFAFLKSADYIVVTGDSMSMCSESCSAGKPVYIYNPKEICSKKHLKFHQGLFDNNYARVLNSDIKKLETGNSVLDETARIGLKVNDILNSKDL